MMDQGEKRDSDKDEKKSDRLDLWRTLAIAELACIATGVAAWLTIDSAMERRSPWVQDKKYVNGKIEQHDRDIQKIYEYMDRNSELLTGIRGEVKEIRILLRKELETR